MRICMVVPPFMDFGGLEKIAALMAVALRDAGHAASVLTIAPAAPGNQYVQLLRAEGIPLVQPPAGLWDLATDWEAKTRAAGRLVNLAAPLAVPLAVGLMLTRRQGWRPAWASVRGRLTTWVVRFLGPDYGLSLQQALLGLWRLRWRYDLLHLHGYTHALAFALDWAHAHGVPTVYAENQTPDARFDWWQDLSQRINQASVVLAASESSARALRDVCGVQRPIETFLPIVPDPFTQNGAHLPQPRAPGAPIRVTTVARLYVTKGLSYLLETIALVRAAHPETLFTVYGDGPLRAELLGQAASLGLDGERIFAGAFTAADLAAIMARTDLFVSSSVIEGLPLAIVEAMSYGCPIVATAAGGVPEIIEDGVSGCLCPTGDPPCLAQAIVALIEDPARRSALGRAARQAYEQGGFTSGAVARKLLHTYQQALQLT
jgi:glycosyltransferase involved in cell wall biosynthesis